MYNIYIYTPSHPMKGFWWIFFKNFDDFGVSKVARRSERGGGKKPQVQEKVPCVAIFCLVLKPRVLAFVFGSWLLLRLLENGRS